jgi:hypothetical protein
MTQDDIKKLAIEASDIKAETWSGGMDMTWDEIERFAELVAAVERKQREWQGLTKEELSNSATAKHREGAMWAAAKLKEKNT